MEEVLRIRRLTRFHSRNLIASAGYVLSQPIDMKADSG